MGGSTSLLAWPKVHTYARCIRCPCWIRLLIPFSFSTLQLARVRAAAYIPFVFFVSHPIYVELPVVSPLPSPISSNLSVSHLSYSIVPLVSSLSSGTVPR
ncbi:uncharacterized protein C8Q71DRAFT_792630 [Rhodofomes roseus]|uniref:Uncharacterized protein n=1 Tax=Rhodofomes roseus TaxID=34475 RepID=A0ABQ8JXH6_9APHY|nr:uncharacterized protein C8Q71DRAFT_792630 [Rhodofomes roseus]KAH9828798.1 hypothetical protein C8Q71DRAFT_792630 [Rhodofomes roseus]